MNIPDHHFMHHTCQKINSELVLYPFNLSISKHTNELNTYKYVELRLVLIKASVNLQAHGNMDKDH